MNDAWVQFCFGGSFGFVAGRWAQKSPPAEGATGNIAKG